MIIGAVCFIVVLGGCAAYILPQMVHKPVAHPAQSVPARAIAHDRADAVAVSVTSVQSAEVPKKKDVESEPTSVDGPASGGTAQVEKGPGTKIEVQFDEGLGTEDTHARNLPSDDDDESNDDSSPAPPMLPSGVSSGASARQSLAL